LSEETTKINLEHHTWLKDSFLAKIGKKAPNLVYLSLKRTSISNESFKELVGCLSKVEELDISECPYIEEDGLLHFFSKCGATLKKLSASNCQAAITDASIKALCNLEGEDGPLNQLTNIDLSFCKLITDEGLKAFEGKAFPITTLNLTGCIGITGAGLVHPITATKDSLLHYMGGLMDQEGMKVAEFGKALGHCLKLQSLDIGGNTHMTDEFINHLTTQIITIDGQA
jgi:hypothetical protein